MSEAPAEVWVRANEHDNGCQAMLGPAPDAVRYVRADLYEVLVTRLRAALESVEDNDVDGVERILRTALKLHLEASNPR